MARHHKSHALTRRQLRDAEHSIHHISRSLRKKHETTAHMVHGLVSTLETGGTLFGWGVAHGRFGVFAPMGISMDLIVGLVLSLAGMFELGGEKVAYHVMNVGEGSLGSFLMRKGVQLGTQLRVKAGKPALATFTADGPGLGHGLFAGEFARAHGGMPVPNAGRELTDEELRAMHRAARAAA